MVSSTIKTITQTYPKDVKIVYKHQPLPYHQNAMPAAEAAEAAREQGRFWGMHDLIFLNQRDLGSPKLEEWAKQIGLNMVRFHESIQQHKNKKRIEEDSKLGASVGAGATPTFFVNGRVLLGALPFENFKTMIDQEISKANELLKQGNRLDASFYGKIVAENIKKLTPVPSSPGAKKAE